MNAIVLDKYYDFYAIDEYCCEEKVLPRPPKVIGKVHMTKPYKKRVYFCCRNALKTRQKLTANKIK